ncbi:hypothetical protein N7468_000546 [Penicillium chermesinum]|uniref:Uncharacterized protein n=1 Tax=Penicillium chermesinum TaxID=63820 RepID=A0A9W9TZG6_9EURO|nr:uncharacterized protein N7468_000546 [Penicillium chermesinum]KAJ5249095.1 hypothetical protein N7468_000546 [Penicillium chermesinum]
MGRTVDQEVHAAFVEFRAKEDDKCLSVQCIYCQQIRAKNTSRQKQHLLECPGLRGHPNAAQPSQPAQAPNGLPSTNGYPGTPSGPTSAAPPTGPPMPTPNGSLMSNGVNPHGTPLGTPLQTLNRPPMATPGPPTVAPPGSAPPSAAPSRPTPKPKPKSSSTSNLPAPPLDDVHAAFVEFRAKEEDKCLSVQCIYCQQVRAKNTSRQRQHLLECPTYLSVMKDSIPANNLLHTFPEGDVARSLQIPAPTLELDFRMSIKMNPKVSPGGQDTQIVTKDSTTNLHANYLLQTAEEPPAFIMIKADGWLTGAKDVLDKVNDSSMADGINPGSYKYRINLSMETGDERYTFLNTLMWIGSGCRRGQEVIFDAFRVN